MATFVSEPTRMSARSTGRVVTTASRPLPAISQPPSSRAWASEPPT
jgi:hypothetical protein